MTILQGNVSVLLCVSYPYFSNKMKILFNAKTMQTGRKKGLTIMYQCFLSSNNNFAIQFVQYAVCEQENDWF